MLHVHEDDNQTRKATATHSGIFNDSDLKLDCVSACLADNVSVIFGKHKQEWLIQCDFKCHVIPKYLQNCEDVRL